MECFLWIIPTLAYEIGSCNLLSNVSIELNQKCQLSSNKIIHDEETFCHKTRILHVLKILLHNSFFSCFSFMLNQILDYCLNG